MKSKSDNGNSAPPMSATDDNGLTRSKGRIWIPESDSDMKMKLIVVGESGQGSHRGAESTASSVNERYIWKSMQDDVAAFIRN